MNSQYKYKQLAQSDAFDFRSVHTFSNDKKKSRYDLYSRDGDTFNIMPPQQKWIDCICTSMVKILAYLLMIVTFPISLIFTLKLVRQYERIVVYRLGRLAPAKGPGLVLILPCVDTWQKVDLRTKAFHIPPTNLCTCDGCVISIGAMIHFRIEDPLLMSISVQDVNHAMRDSALSDMTNLLCKKTFHEIKTKRQRLGCDLQTDINQACREWGAEVSRVELSDVTLVAAPQNDNPSPFMPMYGQPPPPDASQASFGGGALGGLAQIAQQFIAATSSPQQFNATAIHPSSSPSLTINDILQKIKAVLSYDLIRKVGATYEFNINDVGTYFLDLRNLPGAVGEGRLPSSNPDVILKLSLNTLHQLLNRTMSPTHAYSTSLLELEGSTADAMRLEEVFKCIQ